MAPMPEPEDLARHEDVAVRVWNDHLEGYSTREIWRYSDISLARVRSILEAPPPALIEADLRYRTGQKAVWISQEGNSLRTRAGDIAAFLVILQPRTLSHRAWNKGLRAIRRAIRKEAAGFDFSGIAEPLAVQALLHMVHNRGYPAWEIDAQGEATPYDGRHGDLIPGETAPTPRPGM